MTRRPWQPSDAAAGRSWRTAQLCGDPDVSFLVLLIEMAQRGMALRRRRIARNLPLHICMPFAIRSAVIGSTAHQIPNGM